MVEWLAGLKDTTSSYVYSVDALNQGIDATTVDCIDRMGVYDLAMSDRQMMQIGFMEEAPILLCADRHSMCMRRMKAFARTEE